MIRFRPACAVALLVCLALCGAAVADMMADSPVTFPEKGALPSKFPPDRPSKDRERPEEGYYLFGTPERSLEQIEAIRAAMPEGTFDPVPQDWTHLPRTRRILTEGGDLHVLGLGDSIVNDIMRSAWLAKLAEAYPKARVRGTVYVRGGGGCHHYKEEDRIAKHVVPRKPDLVFIGGISQKDMASIREVVHQVRAALPKAEFLLATGVFGTADPRDAEALARAGHSGTGEYGRKLKQLAEEEKCAYLDMTTPWAQYIRASGVHPHRFYRDRVHANAMGEQILSKILMAFFKPQDAPGGVGWTKKRAPTLEPDVPRRVLSRRDAVRRDARPDKAGRGTGPRTRLTGRLAARFMRRRC
ncbi:MAG: SGNH/GDSL hydrolase family protein [Phycisphaerae bacterium]